MMKLIHHFCTVAVLLLVIFGNCVISQKATAVAGSDQQKVLSSTTTTTTTIKPLITSSTAATTNSTTSSAKSVSSKYTNASGEILKITESTGDEVQSSAEILSETGDVARLSIIPTTYRPARPSIAPHISAQERERKLMNVLAARRTALSRGGYRSRVGTTGRTAIAISTIETTPKTPTDPRSICIRNCTKNFTRRTTASCMRQCANFQRNNVNNNGTTIVVKAGSKTGLGTQSERDTNEILFTDESSHGLFVVAKDQNDTLNHIREAGVKASGGGAGGSNSGYKFRSRGKPGVVNGAVTIATTSIEDDDIAPYLYFGQKLPPIRPAMLAITSVSDEHPKLLEVSVVSTTPPSSTTATRTTSTLSPVERSRSRYKYNMRDRGNLPFNRRFSGTLGPRQALLNPADNPAITLRTEGAVLLTNATTTTTTTTTEKPESDKQLVAEKLVLEEPSVENLQPEVAAVTTATPASTPLFIRVLGEEDEVTEVPKEIQTKGEELKTTTTTATTTAFTTSTASPKTTAATTTAARTTAANTTAATTTAATTTSPLSPSSSTTTKITSTPTTRTTTEPHAIQSSTTNNTTSTRTTQALPPPSTSPPSPSSSSTKTTTKTSTTTSTSTTTTSTTAVPRTKSIIEEDTEKLRALGPSLTQQINTDERTNLIIFVNRSDGVYIPNPNNHPTLLPKLHSTTIRPTVAPLEPILDPASTILHTSVLTSVRSTVHPRTSTDIIGGVQRSSSATALDSDTSSTIVADEREVTIEMRRINMATYVLAGIGIFPLIAVIAYVMRNIIMRRNIKADEAFDVCITDQQPISPVKKLDSKYPHDSHDDEDDEVDHHQQHQLHQHHHLNHHPPLHKQHSSPRQQQHKQRDANFNIKTVGNNISNNNNNMITSSRYDEHCSVTSDQEFDRNNIRLKSLLGEGNFGQVWKAEADDLSGHFGATRIVAVKTVRACSAQVGLKDEANIMRKLGSHQNVVTLLGACVESEPHMLIMEYAMRGRLLSLLRAARSATNILPASVPGGRSLAPLSPRTLAGFALDIACGMEYIAERRIVHRDLAARNVLLDHNGVCKICDFGMSIDLDAEQEAKTLQKKHKKEEEAKNCANEIMRSNSHKFKFDFGGRFIMNHWSNSFGNHNSTPHKDSNEKKSQGHSPDTISRRPALPIRWMAPEALQYHVFTTETDIWAFGIVLWEIATLGSTPYSHLTGREVIRNVPNGLRPDLPKEGRHEFYKLMARCWHKEPHLRPSFTHSRMEISRSLGKWVDDDSAASDYMDVSGFSEDLEHGMVYFNHRISEFECEI